MAREQLLSRMISISYLRRGSEVSPQVSPVVVSPVNSVEPLEPVGVTF